MAFYTSTRNDKMTVNSYEAILKGLSSDGGLFVPKDIETFEDIYELKDLNYVELAEIVMGKIFNDVDSEELSSCIKNAYDDKFDTKEITPLVKKEDCYFLELFHGPTCAFKDVALAFLPRILSIANKKVGEKKKTTIITATSGDTGKAALEGFKDVEGIDIKVLYPYKMVSMIQERQMSTSSGNNVEVLAVKGNFDDCQRMAKAILKQGSVGDVHLSSANSINIGRLVPQIVYYFKAYFDLLNDKEIEKDELVDFIVPTGNFGDILAGYFAKKMGLKIGKLVCASNENDVLTDFINTGVYDANRPFYNTMSPSVDILVSSNLERLLYYVSKDCNKVKQYMKDLNDKRCYTITEKEKEIIREDFVGVCANQIETGKIIREFYEKNNYLVDTHTAIALACKNKYETANKQVILSTASPFKFSKDVYRCLTGSNIEDNLEAMDILAEYTGLEIPENLSSLKNKEIRFTEVIEKDDIETIIKKLEVSHV